MLTIVIQAGGESRRMGRDKGLVPFLGEPLIRRAVERMRPAADELILTTNKPADYAFLNLPLFTDLRPGRGALGGLFTALKAASHPLAGVIACDMPFASPRLLRYQADVLEGEGADVVIPMGGEGYEPLHAVYRRETCLPAVEWALDSDLWKLTAWFSKVNVRVLTQEECLRLDPAGRAFSNVNTPEEVAAAEETARKDLPTG